MKNGLETIVIEDFSLDAEGLCASDKDKSSRAIANVVPLFSVPESDKAAGKSQINDDSRADSFQQKSQFAPKTPILLPASSLCLQCLKAKMSLGIISICAPCQFTNHYLQQIDEGRLSVEHWQLARRLLELPENFSDYSTSEVGRGRNLMNWMVEILSPADNLSQSVLAEIMLESHSTLGKKASRKIRNLITPNDQKITNISNTHTTTVPAKPKKAAKSNRKPISQSVYNQVAMRQGSFCYWCGIAVVREQSIPEAKRVSKNNSTILYYAGGELREAAVGTIDHLLRVADGGGNNSDNHVISCALCNIERDRLMRSYNQLISRRRIPCHNCGGRFFHIDWGCCSICGAGPRPSAESPKVLKIRQRSLLILKIVRLLAKLVYRATH